MALGLSLGAVRVGHAIRRYGHGEPESSRLRGRNRAPSRGRFALAGILRLAAGRAGRAPHWIGDLKDAVAKGFDDFNAVPSHAVFLGIIYAILGLIIFRLAFGYDVLPLVYPMLAGSALLGPIAAVALYDLSRRRERGLDTSVWHMGEVFRSPQIGAIARLGLVLTAIFFVWLGLAQVMYVQIMGGAEPTSLRSSLTSF